MSENAEEAFRLFLASHFDVVVTDYGIPSMGGIELIRRIREVKPHARVVLLSRFVEALGLTEEKTGADAVIAKNSKEPANLVRCVNRLIKRAPARKPAVSQSRSALARARA
jgi:DNA-binding NarL/FixJ family response regulator